MVHLLALLRCQPDPDKLGPGRLSSCHSFYELRSPFI
jgi:hypothetical protein